MLTSVLVSLALAAVLAASALVYWDAARIGVASPVLWASLVFWAGVLGLGLFVFVPTIPVPGLLVIALVGPVFYLFERDDTRHGDEPANPHVLPDSGVDPDDDRDG